MGQKVSPVGLRIGVNKSWQSNWYAEGKLNAKYIKNDDKIRKALEKRLKDAAVSSIVIERDTKKTNVTINTAKPGVVIGHGGEEIEKIKKDLSKLVDENIQISIKEVKNPVGLKVLGDGEITVALTVKANKFSKAAKEAIEKAGGTVEVI